MANTSDYNNKVRYNKGIQQYNNSVKIVDSVTGQIVEILHIGDSTRVARNKDKLDRDEAIQHKTTIKSNLLGQFIGYDKTKKYLNASSCVNALGTNISNYIKMKLETTGDKELDLGAVNDDIVKEDLRFKNYIKTGTDLDKSYKASDGIQRLASNMGIGLGECTVMNPSFQFNKRDDVRTNPIYTKIGRVYSSQVMRNWPVVLFQPGRLKYNNGFFKMLGLGSGAGVTEALIRTGGEGLGGKLASLFSVITDAVGVVGTCASAIFGGSRVCQFKQNINLYNQYFRFLAMDLAAMMGLFDGAKYNGSTTDLNLTHVLSTTSLSRNGNEAGLGTYLYNQYIPFRCTKGVVGSESFSNATTTNPLMEQMNDQAESNSEESQGTTDGNVLAAAGQKIKNGLLNIAGKFSEQAMILSGRGRITLPDVFSSSSFSRSFSCNFTFHSPYGDNMSIFENCYIPFLMLLAMGIPRQTGKLSYTSPFAVRVFIKNHIMINYGMIESISVTRGGDSNDWTPSGYPKTLSVSVSIKDMEPNVTLPLASRGPLRMGLEAMFPSTGMSEYLASLGGLSLDEMSRITGPTFRRAKSMFMGGWTAKMNIDNMTSTVLNNNFMANIAGMFTSVDIDRYNKLGDVTGMQYTKNDIKISQGYPGSIVHSISVTGTKERYGDFHVENAAEKAGIEAIIKDMDDTIYP